MPHSLSDPTLTTYLLFAVLVAVAGAVWARLRTRKATAALAVAVALLASLVAIDQLVESPREEAKRRLEALARAATDVQPDRFVENLSKSFTLQGADRERLRTVSAWGLIRQHDVRVTVSGMGHDDTTYLNDDEVEVTGYVKAQLRSGERVLWFAKSRFVRDPDRAFRMQTIQFFDPINTRQTVTIPGFP